MPHRFTTSYCEDSISIFRMYKGLAERAIAQTADRELCSTIDAETNSIAVIVKHMSGNMRSRWRDFLTTDGEKPDRNRDTEFEDPPATRAEILECWEKGWKVLFATLEQLSESDLTRTVTIRGEAHSVMQAINRQVGHLSYHCGQIVLLAKHFAGERWKPLTNARGQSETFNRMVVTGAASQR